MILIRPDDPRWPAHVAASVSEGVCPRSHHGGGLRPADPPWLRCFACDTFWTVDGRQETAEERVNA